MNAAPIQELSLLGGPLHRLGCRLRLVRGGTNTIWLGVALGLLAWGSLVLLGILAGFGPRLLSLDLVGIHVRLLVAVPLLFVCETWVAPTAAEFARYAVRAGVVPQASLPALAAAIGRVGRMKNSGVAEAILLLAAFAFPAIELITPLPGRTGNWLTVLHSPGEALPGPPFGTWGFACRSFAFSWLAPCGGWGFGGTSSGAWKNSRFTLSRLIPTVRRGWDTWRLSKSISRR